MRDWRTIEDQEVGGQQVLALAPVQHVRTNWLTFVESERWVSRLPDDELGAVVLCPRSLTEEVWRRGHKPVATSDPCGDFWDLHRAVFDRMGSAWNRVVHSLVVGQPFKVFRGELVPALGGLIVGKDCTFGAFSVADRGIYGEYTEIRTGVHVDNHVHIGHSAIINDGARIAAGAIIGGWAEVGADTFVGIGAVIKDSVKVGSGCTVGAGAVVVKDMPDNAVWAGVPAGPNFRSAR